METAVQFPVRFSFEDVVELVRRLPEPQREELVAIVRRETARQRWQALSEQLPDADISEAEIQEEIEAYRREKRGGN